MNFSLSANMSDFCSDSHKYLMESFHLENVECAKNLGTTIDCHLKFNQHCSLVQIGC